MWWCFLADDHDRVKKHAEMRKRRRRRRHNRMMFMNMQSSVNITPVTVHLWFLFEFFWVTVRSIWCERVVVVYFCKLFSSSFLSSVLCWSPSTPRLSYLLRPNHRADADLSIGQISVYILKVMQKFKENYSSERQEFFVVSRLSMAATTQLEHTSQSMLNVN